MIVAREKVGYDFSGFVIEIDTLNRYDKAKLRLKYIYQKDRDGEIIKIIQSFQYFASISILLFFKILI